MITYVTVKPIYRTGANTICVSDRVSSLNSNCPSFAEVSGENKRAAGFCQCKRKYDKTVTLYNVKGLSGSAFISTRDHDKSTCKYCGGSIFWSRKYDYLKGQ